MYLIRWRYKANTILNMRDEDTPWYDLIVEDESVAHKLFREKKSEGLDFEIEIVMFELRQIA